MDNNEKSRIDSLKERLDSRNFKASPEIDRSAFIKKPEEDFKKDWSEEGVLPNENNFRNLGFQMANRKSNLLKLFLLGSVTFFFLALIVAFFVIFGGGNIISSDNVEISVSGPVSVSGGEVLSLDIVINNKNNTALELADLIIEYPEGTRNAKDLSKDLPRERFSLGNIKSNSKVNKLAESILFGEEGSHEKIKLTVEYRVAGSNAIFFTEKDYEVEISSSPVSFNIESLKDVNSGKEISLEVSLKSNSNNLIENLMFVAEFPFGFTFKEATPKPSYEQNIWKIGDLAPGEDKKIKIVGIIEGQDGEERVFRFFSGIQDKNNDEKLEKAFVSVSQSIFIKKPFLALDMTVDDSRSENYSTAVSKIVNVEINWENNLPTNIANLEIEAKLSGDFNENSVFVDKGFYNSINNTITWNEQGNPAFDSISPGQSGTVSFKFTSSDPLINSLSNPEASIVVSVKGRRLSESQVSEEINSSIARSIRFNTNISLVPRMVHFSGPIGNTGQIPPIAEKETTYTVIWTVNNTVNNASKVIVSSRLPSYVRWTEKISPSSEQITYNPVSREVVWNVGSLESGNSSREVAFQIAFLPSLSQVGTAPILIEKSRLVGEDEFTGAILDVTKGELTTKISTDPGYKSGDEKVSP
jgi:hypothetical protein